MIFKNIKDFVKTYIYIYIQTHKAQAYHTTTKCIFSDEKIRH